MKKIVLSLLSCLVGYGVFAQDYDRRGEVKAENLPVISKHYQDDYMEDWVVNPEAWNSQQGLQAAFGSTDQLYMRREVPSLSGDTKINKQTVWKGERANIQLLIWSADTLEQVRLKISDLKTAAGSSIRSDQIKTNLVRYVISNYPYAAKNSDCDNKIYKDGFLMPDRFEPFERFDLVGKSLRPVWISVDVPRYLEAGVYEGIVQVQTANQTESLKISLTVQDQTLPVPYEWKHRLDLWQNPWVVAWRNNLKPWSPEHKMLLRQHLQPYADAGGKFITTYAVHSPWADNSYMIEGGMIEWIKQTDGSWVFDYTIFDEYVELAMDCGIDKAITIYSPIPWGSRFRYMDEATGNYVYESWLPDSEDFRKNWTVFLNDLKGHLELKGWFDITYLGINENEMKQTLAAMQFIKGHLKDWKITYAGDWHPELDLLLDDYCFLYNKEATVAQVEARRARGATTTYYVCCNPPVPNNFVFSPPIEGRWISWYSIAHKYDGFLRWAYDAWNEDPNRDGRHIGWPSGDIFLIYPGGNSCIRFEKMREGIVDFEKINIVREKAAQQNNKKANQLLKQLDEHLKVFLAEQKFEESKISLDVKKGKDLLDAISDALD